MRYLALLLLTFLTYHFNVNAQNQRYLERKNYQETAIQGAFTLYTGSLDESNSRLAVSQIDIEMKGTKMLSNYHATLLNLTNGRLESNFTGKNLKFVKNDLLMVDFSDRNGEWQSVLKKVDGNSYLIDSETKKEIKIPFPSGYILHGTSGNMVYAMHQSGKTMILERSGDEFVEKHTLNMWIPKVSEDGSKMYGRKGMMKTDIVVYDLKTGQLLQTFNVGTSASANYQLLSTGQLIGSNGKDINIFDTNGKVQQTFSNDGNQFYANEQKGEIISVSPEGIMKLRGLNSGEILFQATDTYIGVNSGISSKAPSSIFPISNGKFYLVTYPTGIMSLFSSEERNVIAHLFFDKEDWAVIAKNGRIDGTEGAFNKLEWREYSGNTLINKLSLESSFNKYFTPRLLYSILSGEKLIDEVVNISEDISSIPVLEWNSIDGKVIKAQSEITSKQKNIKISASVAQFNEEVQEVRLYQNGKLIAIKNQLPDGNYDFDISLNSNFGESNFIYLITSNSKKIDSEKLKLTINYKFNETAKSKLYALIVGVNKYQNPKYELNYAIPDAEAVSSFFKNTKNKLFESVEVKTLFENEVTKEGIQNAFTDISQRVQEQDVFIFYYAGHGTMTEGSVANDFYIVPHDVTQLYGNDVLLNEKAVSAKELRELSLKVNAQKQVFILDACHSGGALNSASSRGVAEERAIGQLARSTGTFWLTASDSEQFASELETLGHGVFTYSILEALQGKNTDLISDGKITVRELSSYLEQRVPELSETHKGKPQYPASFSFGNDFPLLLLSE